MSRYADWKAPKQDDSRLIWPAADRLIDAMTGNRARLDDSEVLVQNKALNQWRRQIRAAVLGEADTPVIATGHQIELYHPGVWAKNLLLDAVAKKTGATALHVAVDTDSPKHLQLRWPGGAVDMSDDILLATGEWSGQVAQPSARHLKKIIDRFEKASAEWSFKTSIRPVFDSLEASQQTAKMLPQALVDGARALDKTLGLEYETRLLSSILSQTAYLAFVHHIAADVEQFAAIYNQALADYRKEAGITSSTRPMPDLRVEPDSIELPFWFDCLSSGDRVRATVIRENGVWHFLADEAAFAFDPSRPGDQAAEAFGVFCRKNQIRLTPRALTLTMFMRLLLVDQFVHGIGGGRYDQVTDRIIERYFQLAAPEFAVTTATLIFPDAGQRDPECVPCLLNAGHRLRHSTVDKAAHLQQITQAPRRSADRRTAYVAMHADIRRATAESDALARWKESLDRAIARRDREAVLFDRELFYAVQPRDRLERLIGHFRSDVR